MVAMPEELRATLSVDEPKWKTTLPLGVPEVPTAETLAVSVYSEPAVKVPVGEADKTVAEAGDGLNREVRLAACKQVGTLILALIEGFDVKNTGCRCCARVGCNTGGVETYKDCRRTNSKFNAAAGYQRGADRRDLRYERVC